MTDKFGRRPVIFAGSITFTVGAILLAFSVNKEMLLIGRLIVGAGVGMKKAFQYINDRYCTYITLGLASVTVPMYIAEAAPAHLRGRLVTMNNLFITGGQFIASLIAGGFSYVKHSGWR